MEQKNTIIALILIFIVWLIFSTWFAPETPQTSTKNQTESEKITKNNNTNKNKNKIDSELSVDINRKENIDNFDNSGKDIVVNTKNYKAVFNSQGARLLSLKLKKYRETADEQSNPVELIKKEDYNNGTFITRLDGSVVDIADKEFKYNGSNNIIINNQKSIDFVYVTETYKVIKTYTFYDNSYKIDLNTEIKNISNSPQEVVLSTSLQHYIGENQKTNRFIFEGPITYLTDDKLQETKIEDLKEKSVSFEKDVKWSGYEDKYYLRAAAISGNNLAGPLTIHYSNNIVYSSFFSPAFRLEQGEAYSQKLKGYMGPRQLDALKAAGSDFHKAIDFGFFSLLSRPLLKVLKFFNSYVHNYGFAIIILTIIIKIIFWPLTQKSYTSMKSMQKLQPQMQKIREKYSQDKEKLNQEMMKLYKENRVNPMGGCLPMLVQIPVFIALYRVLWESIELRHAPFIFWIQDLSVKDPYYITPIVMGATMFIQQRMTPSQMDPTQAKLFMLMPVVFTFIFINFPAGLVVYWLVNNLLTIFQQYLINKKSA